MKRNNLTGRMTPTIKRSRAAVNADNINQYFDNLETSLKGFPPENIWNYDETNMRDDTGKRKVIVKRGTKYPERVLNCSKVAYSVMFCGNGKGEMLPPYICYKAEHLSGFIKP